MCQNGASEFSCYFGQLGVTATEFRPEQLNQGGGAEKLQKGFRGALEKGFLH